jgi:hypothetical protein
MISGTMTATAIIAGEVLLGPPELWGDIEASSEPCVDEWFDTRAEGWFEGKTEEAESGAGSVAIAVAVASGELALALVAEASIEVVPFADHQHFLLDFKTIQVLHTWQSSAYFLRWPCAHVPVKDHTEPISPVYALR